MHLARLEPCVNPPFHLLVLSCPESKTRVFDCTNAAQRKTAMGGSESKEAGPKALQRARMMVDENRVMLFR